jgi:hypothetical protein
MVSPEALAEARTPRNTHMSRNTLTSEDIDFAISNNFVPSSEQTITVSLADLRQIITEAVHEAIQPLQDHIESLETTAASQREELASMSRKMASLETLQEQDTTRICLDIAYDRRRLAALENPIKGPGKTETSRAERIEKYLASRPDHRATFETLKGHLGIDKDRLKDAIKTLMAASPGRYGIVRTPGDKRKRILVMLPK